MLESLPGFTIRFWRGRPVVSSLALLNHRLCAANPDGFVRRPSTDFQHHASNAGMIWLAHGNRSQAMAELLGIRQSVPRGRPYGNPAWQQKTAARLGLESTFRDRKSVV